MMLENRLQFALPVILTLAGVGLAVFLFSTDESGRGPSPLQTSSAPRGATISTAPEQYAPRGVPALDSTSSKTAENAPTPEASARETPDEAREADEDQATDPEAPCAKLSHKLAYLPERAGQCDRERCRRAGGECGLAGLDCPLACLSRASDADEPCTSDRDCEGDCIAPPQSEPGERVTGRCYHLGLARGCHARVRDGVHAGVICIE